MVQRNYLGLGQPGDALRHFEALIPHAEQLMRLRAECPRLGPDHMALGIALDGLDTAAFHFTRRRRFFEVDVRMETQPSATSNHRLGDRTEAIAAFEGLRPYWAALRALKDRCRPFGRDYLALQIATQTLETAAYHFTRIERFYALGDRGDRLPGSGPPSQGG
ncbi:hypothetical protein [Phenylobacterium deserti]|uniref:Uncharacterized protein n=1 Tax=Phenylobacterium deserti TaxID=1914756 RepID=A0A328ADK2_9CAUL|nr:hypothetical protein [Phenylobacterium deserti]RAK52739.1 hypothetical protein DJ018_11155 [Phenylobacterium deserti]